MKTAICDAIRSRSIVCFSYDGGTRTVEPYCHGTSTAGHEVLSGYQTAGYSESGRRSGWKLFDVSKIFRFEVTEETFPTNRRGYNPHDQRMEHVHCRVPSVSGMP